MEATKTPETAAEPKRTPDAFDPLFLFSLIAAVVGVLLIGVWAVMALGNRFAEGDADVFVHRNYWLAGGLGLFVLGVGLQIGRLIEWLSRKGWGTLLNVIAMIVLAFLLLLFVNFISSRHHAQFDWTSEHIYSISDETRVVLKTMEKDIEIYLLIPSSKQQELDSLRRLVTQYEETSPRIKVKHIDPSIDPRGFERVRHMLGMGDVRQNLNDMLGVVVLCGSYDAAGTFKSDRSKQIPVDELFEIQSQGMGPERQSSRVFKGEQVITGAILEVAEEKKQKIYYLEGHQEPELEGLAAEREYGGFAKFLRQRNYEVQDLKLIEKEKLEIPSDCGVLVIAGPRNPLGAAELVAIDNYLKAGGHLLCLLDPVLKQRPGSEEETYTDLGIESLLKKYNVEVQNKTIFSLDPIPGLPGAVRIVDTAFGTNLDAMHPITKPLQGLRLQCAEARPLKALTANPHAKATELVKSPKTKRMIAVNQPAQLQGGRIPRDAETDQPFTLAIAVEQDVEGAPKPDDKDKKVEDKKATRIVVIGDSDCLSNLLIDSPEGNLELLSNSMQWLVGAKRFVSQAKRPHSYKLDLSPGKAVLFQFLAFPWLPMVPVALGIFVWILRRN